MKNKIKIFAKKIIAADKLWNRDEWARYKKEHPDTKIQPKFKTPSKGDINYENYFLAKKKNK
jgi:hypothetical protein